MKEIRSNGPVVFNFNAIQALYYYKEGIYTAITNGNIFDVKLTE